MARPIISPVSINATAPETFVVLDQRMRVVEEQTSTLLKDLETMGVNGYSVELFPSKPSERSEDHRSVSPLCARVAFVGENDTLWKNCDKLVSRMCRLESVMQTLKLNMFRLQTERDLNPQHAANLEQRLNMVQEEHLQEMRVLQAEGRMLRQRLSEVQEEAEKARKQAERLSASLEIATATKSDVAVAAKELRASKIKMNQRLQELKEQLSKESTMRQTLEESQEALLYRVQDMELTVEKERKQVHVLQQNCNGLRQDIQTAQERLEEEEARATHLEQECTRLKVELESRRNTISKLHEEEKAAHLAFSREHEDNVKLQLEMTALQGMAGKVQVLNEQLNQQCAELNESLRSVTMENAKLVLDHQAALKAEQDKMNQKLQEQDLVLDTARASIMGELQTLQKEKAEFQRQIEDLLAELADYKRKARKVEETTDTQKLLLEAAVARLQSEIEAALQEKDSLLKAKERLSEEMQRTLCEIMQENKKLRAELSGNKEEMGPVKDRLQALEEENKTLTEREAAREQLLQKMEQALLKLTEKKNKLAYDKGKLQVRVQQLETQLRPLEEANAENSRLCKLNAALETKYNQVNAELGSLKTRMQKTEKHFRQTKSALDCREEELLQAVKALRENHESKELMNTSEERGKRKVNTLWRKLEKAKGDNLKVTTMLEDMLVSHTKLEKALQKAHMELERKDSEISGLRKDRNQSHQKIQKLQAELEQCQSQDSLDLQRGIQMDPFCKPPDATKQDNRKLAQNLELAKAELESKEAEYQQLLECRDQLVKEANLEVKLCTEHLETLKKQFQVEREAIKKAAQKESVELKKTLEEACSKSMDVSRSNRELRAKVAELEGALATLQEKVKRQKILITQYLNSKTNNARNAERIKEIEVELRQMEEMKEQYQKKNQEQAVSIREFVTELTSMQGEMQRLAHNQEEVALQNRSLERRLELERQQRQQLEEQCRTLEETVKCLKQCKEDSENKLKEASIESDKATANLEEAHNWFKSKFDSLQWELIKNRQQRIPEEQGHEEEDRPMKLPRQACLKRWETKQQLRLIASKYLS